MAGRSNTKSTDEARGPAAVPVATDPRILEIARELGRMIAREEFDAAAPRGKSKFIGVGK